MKCFFISFWVFIEKASSIDFLLLYSNFKCEIKWKEISATDDVDTRKE
jgi:hypothetical protein